MGDGKAGLLAAVLVLGVSAAQAAPGDITTTFGLKGDDAAQAVAIQPDGRIVVVGSTSTGGNVWSIAIARYTANGSLDAGFGSGGKVTSVSGSTGASSVALQRDGGIVVAGASLVAPPDYDFVVARFTASGAVDQSFGAAGRVTTTFGPNGDFANAIALQPDGKIVAAGSTGSAQQRSDGFALARYEPSGALDRSFGSDGKVTTRFGSENDDVVEAVALQPDGKIVAAGFDFVGSRQGPSDFAVARFTPSGALDSSFGTDGKVTTSFGSASDFANGLVIQPDGKIVVAGYSFQGTVGPSAFALARYMPDGSLDASFGSGGRVLAGVGSDASAWAVTLQPDGKIVAAGTGRGGFALARFNRDGTLDQSFGSGGQVATPVGLGDSATVRGIAVQPSGALVAAGSTDTCTYGDFAVARYTPAGALDSSFGTGLRRCIVPNVKGMTLRAARSAIARRDCVVGPIGRDFSRRVPKGRVIGQFPVPGARCDPHVKIVLRVSKGKP